jgi:hypothetical protein
MKLDLPTMAEVEESRKGQSWPKGLPRPLLKQEKKKAKATLEREFREGVWTRDKKRSRASKKPLGKSGTDWSKVGEVHHVLARSTHPDRIYDVSNGILLSKEEHALAETMCPNAAGLYLLEINGPADRGEKQTFIWRDVMGKELRRRIG